MSNRKLTATSTYADDPKQCAKECNKKENKPKRETNVKAEGEEEEEEKKEDTLQLFQLTRLQNGNRCKCIFNRDECDTYKMETATIYYAGLCLQWSKYGEF